MDQQAEDRLGMTEAQWEWFQAYTRGYGEQDANGVDISLLRENLKLTPTQRLEHHRRALSTAMELERAGQRARLRRTD